MHKILRFFSTKPKITQKLEFNDRGEKLVLQWPGIKKYLKIGSVGSISYLYILSLLDKNSLLGHYGQYSLIFFTGLFSVSFYKFSKLLHRILLLEGGNLVIFEKYPMGGWGHYNKLTVDITKIEGLIAYGGPRWYNPFRFGRGFYKLKFEKKRFGRVSSDHVIFKIPSDYEKDILKIIAIGKPVNEQNLRSIKKYT